MNEKKQFNFRKDLETKGKPGEAEFQRCFPIKTIRLSGRENDFMTVGGETLEIKTDYYTTNNFFFERYSSKGTQTPGGPWQADVKHNDYFVYWFINKNPRPYYIFKTTELVQFLNKYIEEVKPRMIDVPNDGYTTQGFVVPIDKLKDLVHQIEDQTLNECKNESTPEAELLVAGF